MAGENNNQAVRRYTKEFKDLMQAVFQSRAYFGDFFGGGIEALDGIQENQTAFSVKTSDIPVAVGTLLPQRLYDMRLTQFPACGFHFRALLVRCRDHGAGLLTVRTKFLSAGLPHPLHTVQRSGLPHSVWQCRRHKHRGYEQKAEMAFKEFP